MSCVAREGALALLAGDDLDEPAHGELLAHLAVCAGCRERLDELEAGLAWLRAHRHPPGAARAGAALQARLTARLREDAPVRVPWPFALLRRLFEARLRLGGWSLSHEAVVAGFAGALFLVGAVGVLQRPLSRAPELAAGFTVTATSRPMREPHRHDDSLLAAQDEAAGVDEAALDEAALDETLESGDGDEAGADEAGDDGVEALATNLGAQGSGVELATHDPNVRIIWFGEAKTP